MKGNDSRVGPGLGGYFTTEAAMIIPLILILYCIIIYLCFYQYDKCLLSQDSYLVCLEISSRKENPDSGRADLNTAKLFMLRTFNRNIHVEGRRTSIQGSAEVGPAVFTAHSLMPENWRMTFSARAQRYDPAEDVRLYRRIRWILKKGYQFLTQDEEGETSQ